MATLVLGSRGFVGATVLAAAGADAIGMGSGDVDLRSPEAPARLAPLVAGRRVVFAAGVHRQRSDSFETMADNLRMVDNLIEACRHAPPAMLVFLSSVEIYGAPEGVVSESTPPSPLSRYAIGKVAAEHLLIQYARSAGVPLRILRLPGIYGATDGGTSIITRIVSACRGGPSFALWGEGLDLRDYVHVDDVAKAALAPPGRPPVQVLNLATGRSLSLMAIIDMVSRRFGPCRTEPRPGSAVHFDLRFDTTALAEALPDVTLAPLEQGLAAYDGQGKA